MKKNEQETNDLVEMSSLIVNDTVSVLCAPVFITTRIGSNRDRAREKE